MSVASRIQEIETHIGDIYDTLEVGGTDLTDLNKNIVNINSSLKDRYKYFLNNGVEVIWNNWEKVIGEGTEFTLENTIQAPMKINLKGNTYQKSTTGTNYFNALEIPSGSEIVVTNDGATITMPIKTSGNGITQTQRFLKELCPALKVGDVVYLKGTTTSATNTYIYLDSPSSFLWYLGTSRTITQNDLDSPFNLYGNRYTGGETNQVVISDLRIVKNSTDGFEKFTNGASPNPEFPQDIQVVSGDNTIEVVGKNLFDKDNAKHYSTNGSGNTTTITQFNSTDYIPCNSGDSFTISGIPTTTNDYNFKVVFFDSNKNYISRPIAQMGTINIKGSYSTTAPTNAKYVMAQFYNTLEEAQFEKGTEATTYEPYQKESYPISLGDIELCEIGDYQDDFIRNNGKNLFDENYYNDSSLYTKSGQYYAFVELPDTFKTKFYVNMSVKGTNQNLVFGFIDTTASTFTGGIRVLNNGTLNSNVECDFTNAEHVYLGIGNGQQITLTTDIPKIFDNYNIMVSTTSGEPYEPYGKGKWYLEKNTRHLSLAIADMNNDENYPGWKNVSDLLNDYPNKNTLLSNFTDYTCNMTNNDNVISVNTVFLAGGGTLFFNRDAIDLTQTQWKEQYPNLVVELYYGITPTYTEITDSTLISQLEAIKYSYDDQTNISQVNNDMPFKLEVTALKNI